MNCPTCGGNCVRPAQKVLDELLDMYMACGSCPPDPKYNTAAPFSDKIDASFGRCKKCGKRHLDVVIGNVLSIMREETVFPENAALRDVGTPLISVGYLIPYAPRLGNKNLLLIMDSITKELADKIIERVPEIKGVIKRVGSQTQSIGILDTDSKPHTYELLSGCDMRCDVISSSFGELCIYRNQSRIHIEFNNTKIKKIEALYFKGELDSATVVDGFCGPGTLGLLSVMGGAERVILNDAWLPAIQNTIMNIKANSEILGVKVDFETNIEKIIGSEPVLAAKASGISEILVYHGDIRQLHKIIGKNKCDICLIDTFPAVDPANYISVCIEIAKKVVVI
jgi:hypothetical protein